MWPGVLVHSGPPFHKLLTFFFPPFYFFCILIAFFFQGRELKDETGPRKGQQGIKFGEPEQHELNTVLILIGWANSGRRFGSVFGSFGVV